MTVRDALREGAAALSGTETPFLDASLLLARALDTDRSALLALGPESLGEEERRRFLEGIASRARGLSVAYILGYKEFWGRRFAVDGRVLVPRPDTETLVESALRIGDDLARSASAEDAKADDRGEGRRVKAIAPSLDPSSYPDISLASFADKPSRLCASSFLPLRVHDACTGSGCVAISLAADRPDWAVSASDLSEAALELALANAAAILGPDRGALSRPGGELGFARSDLLSSVPGPFDLIVANPPYVASSETDELLARGWSEPRMALDGGVDGLDALRRLVPEAERGLVPGGALLVEADGSQAEAVAALFRASRFIGVETVLDLGGRPRVTIGRKAWRT
jgi:release factor glutamine methyltransferase